MEKLFIIIVDDQREVVNTVAKDIESLSELATIEECESGGEVLELMEEIDDEGDFAAVVISDQVMPGMSGVELLSKIDQDPRFGHTKKIMLTGLATHEDTIKAINQAHIDRYFEKPWDKTTLKEGVLKELTRYILEKGIDYTDIQLNLDQEEVRNTLRKSSGLS